VYMRGLRPAARPCPRGKVPLHQPPAVVHEVACLRSIVVIWRNADTCFRAQYRAVGAARPHVPSPRLCGSLCFSAATPFYCLHMAAHPGNRLPVRTHGGRGGATERDERDLASADGISSAQNATIVFISPPHQPAWCCVHTTPVLLSSPGQRSETRTTPGLEMENAVVL
jgi:hypothetical protein